MSQNPTLEVGGLQLRRTEAGWQYLSEGLGSEPDSWCDATTMPGPFSGTGINTLLDDMVKMQACVSAREDELVECLQHIRGVSSCCSVWDFIDEVVPFDAKMYS
jgi:hypothetical protein